MDKDIWCSQAIAALVDGYGMDTSDAIVIAEKLYDRDHEKFTDGAYAVFVHMDGDEPPLIDV